MRHLRPLLPLALVTALIPSPGYAQSSRAVLSGHVVDPSGGVLQGAQIIVQPMNLNLQTDQQGDFTVRDLDAGTYHVIVSYVGFQLYEKDCAVQGGGVTKVSVQLAVASQSESILVTAERPRGEAEAINRTRVADNIVQVLSAEVITSLPNANVADAIGRLPSVTLGRDEGEGVYVQVRGTEPRLTNVTINGITLPSPEPTVRQVRLDAIPADLVDSVEINKTLQANIDGDGIGGSVNLQTKTASDQPYLNAYALGGFNPILGGRGNSQFSLTAGKRFGPAKRLGVLVGGAYDWNGRGIDDIEPAIDPAQSTFGRPFYSNDTVREYRYRRKRTGITGSADYRLNDFTSLSFHGIYTNLDDFGDKWYYGPQASGSPKFYTSSKSPAYTIASLNGGGHHLLGAASWLTWEVAGAHAGELASAGNPKADFSWIGSKLTCGFDPAAQTDVYTPTFGSGCDAPNTPLQVASNWGFKDITTSTGSASQWNVSGSASYGFNYMAGTHHSTLELGGKIRDNRKSQNASENVYDGWSASSYPMTQFLDPFSSSNYYDNAYYGGHYGPVSNFDQLVGFTESNLSAYLDGYKTAANTYPNIFDLTERIGAGYAMNTVDLASRVRLQAGVRVESTRMTVNGNDVTLYAPGSSVCPTPTGCGVAVPVTASPSYTDVLPSVSLRVGLNDSSNVRLVYGRGLSRPDAYQLVPYVTEDTSSNPSTTAIGNPALQPEHANNYDVLWEQFLQPVGLVQAGFFYKQLSDPLVTEQYLATTGEFAGQLVTQWMNAGSANLYGFELSYQQHLTRLPGALSGVGIFANYSFTASSVKELPGRTDTPSLLRQAPHTWNISPTYDRSRFSVRLGLTYNAPSIFQYAYSPAADPASLGPLGPAGDQYTYPHLQVDAQGSLNLSRNLKLTVYGLNITNEVYGLYAGSQQFVRQREFYRPTVAFGVRYLYGK